MVETYVSPSLVGLVRGWLCVYLEIRVGHV